MDLDQAKFIDSSSGYWPRVGMMICFAVAAGVLIFSIWMPSTAKASTAKASTGKASTGKASGPGFTLQRGI